MLSYGRPVNLGVNIVAIRGGRQNPNVWGLIADQEREDLSLMGNLFKGLHDTTTNAFNELRRVLIPTMSF